MSPRVEDTIAFAAQNHRGQKDRAGKPCILHPLRVMLSMATDEERRVAQSPNGIGSGLQSMNAPESNCYDQLVRLVQWYCEVPRLRHAAWICRHNGAQRRSGAFCPSMYHPLAQPRLECFRDAS